jgi:hypothetical protein
MQTNPNEVRSSPQAVDFAVTDTTAKIRRKTSTFNDIVLLSIVRCFSTGVTLLFLKWLTYFKTKVSIEHDGVRALS